MVIISSPSPEKELYFFFKPYLHTDFFQMAYCGKKVNSISAKREILLVKRCRFSCLTIRNQTLKFITLFMPVPLMPESAYTPRNSIGILYQLVVVTNLCGNRVHEARVLDTGICSDSLPPCRACIFGSTLLIFAIKSLPFATIHHSKSPLSQGISR